MWWITQSQWNTLNRKVDTILALLNHGTRLSAEDQAKLNRTYETAKADAAKIDAEVKP